MTRRFQFLVSQVSSASAGRKFLAASLELSHMCRRVTRKYGFDSYYVDLLAEKMGTFWEWLGAFSF